jgi:AcrR family transcriptional regulator
MERHELLDRAGRTLVARPAATMEDIARDAGVSRATLFRRFPSREALVVELCRRAASAYVAAVEVSEPERGPAPEALGRILGALTALAPAHALVILQPLPDLVEAALLDEVSAADGRVRALVRRGQEAGEFRTDLSPEWVLTAITWLVVGAADGLRLGVLAPRDVDRLVAETVQGALRRAVPR